MYFDYSHEKQTFIPQRHGLKWNFRKKKRCLYNFLTDLGMALPQISFLLIYASTEENTIHEASEIKIESPEDGFANECQIIPVRTFYEYHKLHLAEDTAELDFAADQMQLVARQNALWEALAPLHRDE